MYVQEAPGYPRFAAIPWCAEVLSDPTLRAKPVLSRIPKEDTEDSLLAETLNTNDTVSSTLGFFRLPQGEPPSRIEEAYTLYTLGSAMNGMTGALHGGIIGTLLDETLGLIISLNKNLNGTTNSPEVVTAYLHTRYLKPLDTPATVLVTAELKSTEERKWYIDGTIKNGKGEVLAEAKSLWIQLKESRARL
ncbi:MAG: hypothetical protein LQ340_002267 [Diploschistes diacapsis]|nr:MAG: hypothetical protein LQ340_002267 [Diploschistes diacapsis]